jgi:hypothetical protein
MQSLVMCEHMHDFLWQKLPLSLSSSSLCIIQLPALMCIVRDSVKTYSQDLLFTM